MLTLESGPLACYSLHGTFQVYPKPPRRSRTSTVLSVNLKSFKAMYGSWVQDFLIWVRVGTKEWTGEWEGLQGWSPWNAWAHTFHLQEVSDSHCQKPLSLCCLPFPLSWWVWSMCCWHSWKFSLTVFVPTTVGSWSSGQSWFLPAAAVK